LTPINVFGQRNIENQGDPERGGEWHAQAAAKWILVPAALGGGPVLRIRFWLFQPCDTGHLCSNGFIAWGARWPRGVFSAQGKGEREGQRMGAWIGVIMIFLLTELFYCEIVGC
jgi:hypothetical protein